MATSLAPAPPPERVLSTLNPDGSRRWLEPRLSAGPWWRARRATAYALMVLFLALPYLRIHGHPAVLLDLPRREFTLLGTTFLSTDTLLFMLLFTSLAIAVFLVTSLWGRVWCGWGCPQTVYLEFLFRPIERWFERGTAKLPKDAHGARWTRRGVQYAVYGLLALVLAHTFLAYFVGVETLAQWVRRSPIEHPTSFFVMAGTTLLVFLDFAWFREQTCLVACPYGRLQSVLLDRRSLIVGYDTRRGEPRARGVRDRIAGAGDCIDCRMCVQTCPTGIDIRDGLQMECLHCTQCIDACDAVMVKIGKPRGLVRYSTREELAGAPRRLLRGRVLVYPIALAASLGALIFCLAHAAPADLTLLRGSGAPYTLAPDGRVTNTLRFKIANRSGHDRAYTLSLVDAPGVSLVAPFDPFPVPASTTRTTTVFALAAPERFRAGTLAVTFRIDDGLGFKRQIVYPLVGPEPAPGGAEAR